MLFSGKIGFLLFVFLIPCLNYAIYLGLAGLFAKNVRYSHYICKIFLCSLRLLAAAYYNYHKSVVDYADFEYHFTIYSFKSVATSKNSFELNDLESVINSLQEY